MERSILLQTGRLGAFAAFVAELESQGCAVTTVADADACMRSVQKQAPALVVLDAASQEQAKQDVIGIMRVNALVHTAVVSEMPEDVFHEVMEGLGILASLPTSPTVEDARRVVRLLTEIQA